MVREVSTECRFCGQTVIIDISDVEIELAKSKEDFKGLADYEIANKLANDKAVNQCKCDGSIKFKKQKIRKNFEAFVASDVVNFMDQYKLDEIQVIDGYGNKAKLKKKNDASIEVTKTLKDVM